MNNDTDLKSESVCAACGFIHPETEAPASKAAIKALADQIRRHARDLESLARHIDLVVDRKTES